MRAAVQALLRRAPASTALWVPARYPRKTRKNLPFSTTADGHVQLKVYDLAGRLVRVLVDGPLRRGTHKVLWDGRSERGLPVGSGVYFYRLQFGNQDFKRKAVVVK